MTLSLFKIMLALIVLLTTVVGGFWPFFKKGHLTNKELEHIDFPGGESLATGIFLGAGLLHMLPDATQAFSRTGYNYPLSFLIAGVSFLLLLLLEHISDTFKHRASSFLTSIALLTAIMLSIHSFLEGAAVGLSASFSTTFIIFIAIIAHKGAASFSLSVNLNRSSFRFIQNIIIFSIFAFMTPIGIFCGHWILLKTSHNSLLVPIFSSLAAGTFLYIGTLHGLGRASLIRHCCNMKEFFFMLTGFIVMAIVAIWS